MTGYPETRRKPTSVEFQIFLLVTFFEKKKNNMLVKKPETHHDGFPDNLSHGPSKLMSIKQTLI